MTPSEVIAEFVARVRRDRLGDALQLVAEDFELVLGGAVGARFSGTGRDVMARYLQQLLPLFGSGGAYEVVDLLANDRRVVLLQRHHMRAGGRDVTLRRCSEFRVQDAQITEMAVYAIGEAELDDLLGRD